MAARSKQGRRNKAASAQKSAPQTEIMRGSVQSSGVRHEAAPPQKASIAAERQDGMVHKSTLCLAAVLCLLLGLYLGTLLSASRGSGECSSHAHQSRPQQMPPLAGQGAESSGQLKELEEAVRKNPQDLRAWIQLGNWHFDDDKPHEAIHAYERALAIKGDDPDVMTDMGIMYRQLGDFERAAELFTQAGKINSLHEQSHFNLGVVLFFDLNRKDEARKAWRTLLDINPEVRTPDGVLLRTMLDEVK